MKKAKFNIAKISDLIKSDLKKEGYWQGIIGSREYRIVKHADSNDDPTTQFQIWMYSHSARQYIFKGFVDIIIK